MFERLEGKGKRESKFVDVQAKQSGGEKLGHGSRICFLYIQIYAGHPIISLSMKVTFDIVSIRKTMVFGHTNQ